jgi:PPM family protein phosphatase
MPLTEVLSMAVRTHPGRLRPNNEDAVFCDAGRGLAILADGMGGYNAGEVASSMATVHLSESLVRMLGDIGPNIPAGLQGDNAHFQVRKRINEVNAEIYLAAQSEARYAGMGTTLVVAWFYDNCVTVAHIGDSRLYRMRGETLEQLTRDHSLLQEQLDSGMITPAQARTFHARNLVTRALGVEPVVEPEVQSFDVLAGDIFLLCSDGLSDMVDDREIARALRELGDDPAVVADCLVNMANDHGGRDNVSVILVKVGGEFPATNGKWQKLLSRFGQDR